MNLLSKCPSSQHLRTVLSHFHHEAKNRPLPENKQKITITRRITYSSHKVILGLTRPSNQSNNLKYTTLKVS